MICYDSWQTGIQTEASKTTISLGDVFFLHSESESLSALFIPASS